MSDVKMILEKLQTVKLRFEEIGQQINDPQVIADMKRFVQMNKEFKNLEPIVKAYNEFKNVNDNLVFSRQVLNEEKDDEMRDMAKGEIDELQKRQEELVEEIKLLLIPKDPQDDKNAVLEIRAGTGGDEASIFAGDLFRMYSKYSETKGWKLEVSSFTEGTVGGYKEVIATVSGTGVYG
ncbi:MAG: PCRF domain-containing protein, partial [Bacteroidales bacterium]|nr:PCRF domain-containing protein [Bacteroidales bacterium]